MLMIMCMWDARYKQVCGTMQAEKTENTAMQGNIEKCQKELQEMVDEKEHGMLKFLEMSGLHVSIHLQGGLARAAEEPGKGPAVVRHTEISLAERQAG